MHRCARGRCDAHCGNWRCINRGPRREPRPHALPHALAVQVRAAIASLFPVPYSKSYSFLWFWILWHKSVTQLLQSVCALSILFISLRLNNFKLQLILFILLLCLECCFSKFKCWISFLNKIFDFCLCFGSLWHTFYWKQWNDELIIF